jgi:ParB family chromosome partitioning protein
MGLGRGLGSLIPQKPVASAISEEHREILLPESKNGITQIPVELIEPNPFQPRKVFSHQELEGLIESIKKFGIVIPLIVTNTPMGYQLIAGERRFRSAKIVGLKTVPAMVRTATDQEKMELALIENIQRHDLNPIEKALGYQRLINEFNLTQEEVADKMSVSRPVVGNALRMLSLPEEIQKALADNLITEGHAKVIAGLETEKEQLDFLNKVLTLNFTVRDAEKESRKMRPTHKTSPRPMKDPIAEDFEDWMRTKLGTKVKIMKAGEGGQIVIDYYSAEDLSSIIEQITK